MLRRSWCSRWLRLGGLSGEREWWELDAYGVDIGRLLQYFNSRLLWLFYFYVPFLNAMKITIFPTRICGALILSKVAIYKRRCDYPNGCLNHVKDVLF